MKLLAMGDSLTLGEIGYSYVEYLDGNKYRVTNMGINGDTTEGVRERLERVIFTGELSSYEALVLFVGINDLIFFDYSFRDEMFEEEYRMMLSEAKKHVKNIIVVSLPYVEFAFSGSRKILKRNEILKKLSERFSAKYVDIYSLQEERRKEGLTIDGVHFSSVSARILADEIEKCLKEFLVNS